MSERSDILPSKKGNKPRLAYSCRCGWLDFGHMNPASYRAHEGAQSLWQQITSEAGDRSKRYPSGFKVVYQQSHGMWGVRDAVRKEYWVQYGLSLVQKKSVALTIFMEVSMGFETMQSNWFYRLFRDSGFSVEDLVSNLIGFYRALDPRLDVEKICGVVSPRASLEVWDTYGPVGRHKNRGFEPLFFPCSECRCDPSGAKPCKPGQHAYGNFRVTVGEDGTIVVQPGDWLSKYSAAMYQGDTTRVREFGRLEGGVMKPITSVDSIRAGETIYHVPTYEIAQNPRRGARDPVLWTGPLPAEFRQIPPITKGAIFRDWSADDA